MKIVFVSNYLSPHQIPFCLAMVANKNVWFRFIATSPVSLQRKKLGYVDLDKSFSFVIRSYDGDEAEEISKQIIDSADVVIMGTAPWNFVRNRVSKRLLTFRCSERQLKKGLELHKYIVRLLRWHFFTPCNSPCYLLCASAYTSFDFSLFGLFLGKAFKWGYFPKTCYYPDTDCLIGEKQPNSLVWVARYIDWKHPELALEIGRRLKRDGYDFTISMIGNGPLLNQTMAEVIREGLEKEIHVLGAMSPEEVRIHMENAQIHIFTSDRNEGWGAVLNESMNSCCVPIANRAIGSAPYLIEDGKNGFLYDTVDELYDKVRYLLEHDAERNQMAKAAYHTIVDEWNAENAAEQFVALASQLLEGNKKPNVREKGVCSKAEIMKG